MAHKIVWLDIPVTDLERAKAFYSNVLAIEVEEEFPGVAVFAHEGDEVAGCLFKSDTPPSGGMGPMVYLNATGRLQEAVDLVEQFGGKVEQQPHSIGGFGSRAMVLDSEGNHIALHSE